MKGREKEMETKWWYFLFVLEDNSYKDFIAIVGDAFFGPVATFVSLLNVQASICTFSFEKYVRNRFARQFGDETVKDLVVAHWFLLMEAKKRKREREGWQLFIIMNVGHFCIYENNVVKV